MPKPYVLPVVTQHGTQAVSGESAFIVRPRRLSAATRLVLGFHGATGNERWCEPIYGGSGASYRYVAHIAAHDFMVLNSLWGGDPWGLEATDALVDQAIAWAAAQGIDTTQVGMVGGSGGTFSMCNYWRRHRTKVGALVLFVPAVHIEHAYDDNPTLQTQMDATFGGNAKVNGLAYSPHTFAAELDGPEPVLIYYAGDDVAVRGADIEAFAEDCSAEIASNIEPGGHASLNGFLPDVAQMVRAFDVLRGGSWIAA